jgi:acyl dehydratase
MTSFFGASWFTSGELDLRYVRPAFAGDTLTVGGAILGRRDGRLELEVWVRNDDGQSTALGWASAELTGVTPGPSPLLPPV